MKAKAALISQVRLELILQECKIAKDKINSVCESYDVNELQNALETASSCIYEIEAAINTKGDDDL